jgi:flagellar biosynthesis activator protein FlaF
MLQNKINIYQDMQQDKLTGRGLEAHILSKAALKLKHCQQKWAEPERPQLLEEAVRYNQKIWSFFQSELTLPENPLPRQLRQDLLNLSLFVDKRLFEVLAFPQQEKLDIVIDINLNIAAGLRTNSSQDLDKAV